MPKYGFLTPNLIRNADAEDVNRLLAQLTKNPVPIDQNDLERLCRKSFVFTARNGNGRIVGINTATARHIPTSLVGHMDDLVVDQEHLGQGIGKMLVLEIINHAKGQGVNRLEWTCKPDREDAHRLYQGLGIQSEPTVRYLIKF